MAALIMSRVGRVLLLFGACLGLGLVLPSGEVERGSIDAVGRPNIIFVLTDDLDAASVSKVPSLKGDWPTEGVTFDTAFSPPHLRSSVHDLTDSTSTTIWSGVCSPMEVSDVPRARRERSTLAACSRSGDEPRSASSHGYGKVGRNTFRLGGTNGRGRENKQLNQNGQRVTYESTLPDVRFRVSPRTS